MADTFDEEDDSGQWVNVHTPYGTVAMSPKRARRYSDEVDATYEARLPAPAAPDDSGQWVGVSTPGIGKVYMTPDRARRYSDQADAEYESQRAEDAALSELAGAMDYSGLGKPALTRAPAMQTNARLARPFQTNSATQVNQRTDTPEDLDALQSAMEDFRNRSNAVDVQNVPSTVPLASRMGGQPLPSPQRVAASPERTQQGPTFGEADTLQSAQNRERMLRGLGGMAGATSRIGYLIAGAKPPGENRGEAALTQDAGSQVRDYMIRRQQTEAEKATAEQAALQDPTSPASQRFQAMVSRAFGSVYTPEQIGQMTAADAPLVSKYGEMVRTLEDRAAGRTAEQQSQQAQLAARATEADKQRAFEGKQAGLNRANAREIAGMRQETATNKESAPAKGAVIQGLEIVPGAAPTKEDATKVKSALESSRKMRGYLDQLEKLHSGDPNAALGTKERAGYGTEYGGTVGTNMGQLATAIQLEAKNIAALGALSGPDQGLMESLAGSDPSSFWANVKATFGFDSTPAAIKGLRSWMDTATQSALTTYGYRPSSGGAPAGGQPPTAGATPRRKRDAQGRTWEEGPDGEMRMVL